jgi:hypothetical protein
MNKTEMQLFWQANYTLCPPINFLFKIFYTDRWLRIHSLPDSKRYADTDEEWQILLGTQNAILDDIFKDGETFYLLVGVYSSGKINILDKPDIDNECLNKFDFTPLEIIDLHAISKEYYDEDIFYTPYFATLQYKSSEYNDVLKTVANDEIRVFFLNDVTNTIFAPYDGGVDIIYPDTTTRDFYKTKYSHYTQQENYK